MRGHHLGYDTPPLGRCLDRVFFSTADLVQQREGKKAVQVFTYVTMCSMAEDLFFSDSSIEHPRIAAMKLLRSGCCGRSGMGGRCWRCGRRSGSSAL